MAAVLEDRSCVLGGHRWDLRYTASALRALQMRLGNLEEFSARLIAQNMGNGMTTDTQVLLIWAGQKAVQPKIKLGTVRRLYQAMHPQIRTLLITWAAADFSTALLAMAGARIAAEHPEPAEDAEDGDDE